MRPAARAIARSLLDGTLSSECEDVAQETLIRLHQVVMQQKVGKLKSEDQLVAWAIWLATNIARDKLRRHTAQKRGGGKIEPLDAFPEGDAEQSALLSNGNVLYELDMGEVRQLLTELSSEIKPEDWALLRARFYDQLSDKEIAVRRGIQDERQMGSRIRRALSALKSVISRRPELEREFLAVLGESGTVRVLLPLISAIQLGGWFFEHMMGPGMGPGARRADDAAFDRAFEFPFPGGDPRRRRKAAQRRRLILIALALAVAAIAAYLIFR